MYYSWNLYNMDPHLIVNINFYHQSLPSTFIINLYIIAHKGVIIL